MVDAFFSLLAPETGSFFLVSVWRNRGLAKSVTAAAKKWPRYEKSFFDGRRGQIALTGRFDVEVEDF